MRTLPKHPTTRRPDANAPIAAALQTPRKRRATVLLMVVGLLSMLFLIVSAYITLARFERLTATNIRKQDQLQHILDSVVNVVSGSLRDQLSDPSGRVLASGRQISRNGAALVAGEVDPNFSPVDIPGVSGSRIQGAAEIVRTVREYTPTGVSGQFSILGPGTYDWNINGVQLADFMWPGVSQTNPTNDAASNPNWALNANAPRPVAQATARNIPFVRYPGTIGGVTPFTPWLPPVFGSTNPLPAPGLIISRNDNVVNTTDIIDAALQPYMDADGDGVPDSYLPAQALTLELVNAQAETPVRAPDSIEFGQYHTNLLTAPNGPANPTAYINNTIFARNRQIFDRFEREARYSVATRVVNHGGMVLLEPNSVFSRMMFDWVEDPVDANTQTLNGTTPGQRAQLSGVTGDSAGVEPIIRRRGGLPSARNAARNAPVVGAPIPSSLTLWENTFPRTLRGPNDLQWSRFDISDATQFAQWQLSYFLQPAVWNISGALGDNTLNAPAVRNARDVYNERRLLTTVNNSDELARVQSTPEVVGTSSIRQRETAGSVVGLFPGEPKFFLGEIEQVFDGAGNYLPGPGTLLARRLANYYYDMLGGHVWPGASVPPGTNSTTGGSPNADVAIVSRLHQAWMLAVNTIAFAAPHRTSDGMVDTVFASTGSGETFIGYGPQPFITDVILHVTPSASDPTVGEPSVALQLWNPNDPFTGSITTPLTTTALADSHALRLSEYAISFGGNSDPLNAAAFIRLYQPGDAVDRLAGRQFLTVGFGSVSNGEFAVGTGFGGAPPANLILRSSVTIPTAVSTPAGATVDRLLVRLWRKAGVNYPGTLEKWFQIDEFEITEIPDTDEDNDGVGEERFVRARRDERGESYFGADLTTGVDVPRWRCVTAFENGDLSRNNSLQDGTDPSSIMAEFLPGPGPGSADRDGPTVPLYTMNANVPATAATTIQINGARRPASFPTIGFMHFIPRYSHFEGDLTGLGSGVTPPPGSGTGSGVGTGPGPGGGPGIGLTFQNFPMGSFLREDWVVHGYDFDQWPVDFGHMPIFDNKQAVDADGYFDDSRAGAIPWGLLVYDYFTTRNVSDPDNTFYPFENPLQIRGRININTASWWVLAGLPMIARRGASVGLQSFAANTPPAFWAPASGVMFGTHSTVLPSVAFGTGLSATDRFDDVRRLYVFGNYSGNPQLRLGPNLAQAIASHRDRIPYAPDGMDVATGAPLASFGSAGVPFAWLRDAAPRNLTGVPLASDSSFRMQPNDLLTGDITSPIAGGQPAVYATAQNKVIRRGADPLGPSSDTDPTKYGFVTLGELIQVYGMAHDRDPKSLVEVRSRPGFAAPNPIDPLTPQVAYLLTDNRPLRNGEGDFFKAVSYMVLLDTHYLTTRSNTFTAYTSLMVNDREKQNQSVRSQVTMDRTNILPQPLWIDNDGNGSLDTLVATQQQPDTLPQVLSRRQVGYFNAQYDQ